MAPAKDSPLLRNVFLNSIRSLVEALEAKDPYAAGHSNRVARLALEIGIKLNLDRAQLARLRLAAILHDIGKIGVRESVLNKEGPLTSEEYDHVMQHVAIGKRILEPIFQNNPLLDVVYHHHEHFDGTGRPSGLKGAKIPLGARIIVLADSVDAMANIRAYRPSLPPLEILAEIENHSGSHFDPKVVEAFLQTDHAAKLRIPQTKKEILTADSAASESAAPMSPDKKRPHHKALSAETPPDKPLFSKKTVLNDIRNLQDIKALPFVTAEILQLTANPDSSVDTLVELVMRDPALVAKILKLANTSYYGSRDRVHTVDRAIVNIGYAGIREIALAVAVVDLFQHKEPAGSLDRLSLWRHQIASAVLARAMAAAGGQASPEDAFVAGLLHDFGVSILDDLYPEEYAACAQHALLSGISLSDAEKLYIGVDHTHVAATVAQTWGLTPKLAVPMEYHHTPWPALASFSSEQAHAIMIVKIADIFARASGRGPDCDPAIEDVPKNIPRKLNLDPAKLASVFSSFERETSELETIFLMHANGMENALAQRTPPEQLQGRKVLFISDHERVADPLQFFLQNLGFDTYCAENVLLGMGIQRPDMVVLRTTAGRTVETSITTLADLSDRGKLAAPRVLLFGRNGSNGKLPSPYPDKLTAVVDDPFSMPDLERKLTLLFSN